jgi:hypothetical protein
MISWLQRTKFLLMVQLMTSPWRWCVIIQSLKTFASKNYQNHHDAWNYAMEFFMENMSTQWKLRKSGKNKQNIWQHPKSLSRNIRCLSLNFILVWNTTWYEMCTIHFPNICKIIVDKLFQNNKPPSLQICIWTQWHWQMRSWSG